MKLKKVASDCYELVTRNGSVLFIEEVPIAVSYDFQIGDKWGCYRTDRDTTPSTARKISKWTATTRCIPQVEIDACAHEILRSC